MRHYPAFLDLSRLSCLVVGAGGVGLRKIDTLLACGASSVLVVDPNPDQESLKKRLKDENLRLERREFKPSDLAGVALAFACTPLREVNERVGRLAREAGVLVNVADAPGESTFIVPASFSRGPLTVALSTGGASPAAARLARMELEEHFGPHYGLFLQLMERIRPEVLGLGHPTERNTELFRALAASRTPEFLAQGDREAAIRELSRLLPHELAPKAAELLDGIDESH
ncbi:precorrin-2 dehydrogenase/sirohydrochlorin ferrochelatase family protein [Desulfocurvus sp. DL9XJH121]